eukprot:7423274-Pyramimonas_sp.AAC.1
MRLRRARSPPHRELRFRHRQARRCFVSPMSLPWARKHGDIPLAHSLSRIVILPRARLMANLVSL